MIEERESAGYLLGETAHLLRENAGLALAALGAMTLIGCAADLYPDLAGPAGFASLLLSLALQCEISLALLVHYDLVDSRSRRRRLWALLGVNLLTDLGIVLGLILLVLPGAYLIARWSAAVPAMIAEESGVYDSLGLGAEATEGRFWHVFGAILVVWTPCAVGLLGSAVVPEGEQLIESMVRNLVVNLSLIAGWHLAVAIYAGRKNGTRLEDVFA